MQTYLLSSPGRTPHTQRRPTCCWKSVVLVVRRFCWLRVLDVSPRPSGDSGMQQFRTGGKLRGDHSHSCVRPSDSSRSAPSSGPAARPPGTLPFRTTKSPKVNWEVGPWTLSSNPMDDIVLSHGRSPPISTPAVWRQSPLAPQSHGPLEPCWCRLPPRAPGSPHRFPFLVPLLALPLALLARGSVARYLQRRRASRQTAPGRFPSLWFQLPGESKEIQKDPEKV